MKCQKKLFIKALDKEFPCFWDEKHKGSHTPDLTNYVIGRMKILEHISLNKKGKRHGQSSWIVVKDGFKSIIRGDAILRGESKGIRANRNGKSTTPEYETVKSHHNHVFKKETRWYKNMPFYDEWNPDKGGSFYAGYLWILENLGPRPGSEWSLDIINHSIGFVPGNLRWANKFQQVLNQKHRLLGQVEDEEFAIEAKRRGYIKKENICLNHSH